jgi:hypothetical protein
MGKNIQYRIKLSAITLLIILSVNSFDLFSNTKWDSISSVLLNKCIEQEGAEKSQHYLANMVYYYAKTDGWKSKKTKVYLKKLFSSIDSFGFGLGYEWDAFQDGTINSSKTNYTITITEHVGPIVIEAYKNNVVSKKRVHQLLEAFKKIPLADTFKIGKCIAYSDNMNDKVGCVHNVNISGAYFISLLVSAITVDSSLIKLKNDIIERELNLYIKKDSSYVYWDGSPTTCDQNHLSYQAWCMNRINDVRTQEISNEIIKKIELNFDNNLQALIGQVRLASINKNINNKVFSTLNEIFITKKNNYKEIDGYYFHKPRTLSELLFLVTRLK